MWRRAQCGPTITMRNHLQSHSILLFPPLLPSVEDASASQEECMSYSRDTKGPNACISDEHNKAHEGCHNNGSGASQKAATQGVTEEMTHLAQTWSRVAMEYIYMLIIRIQTTEILSISRSYTPVVREPDIGPWNSICSLSSSILFLLFRDSDVF